MTAGAAFRLPAVMGHRGAAAAAPENSLAGFREAARQGATWVEFDATLSSDGLGLLFHDATLLRTGGCKGQVASTRLAELQRLDIGSWFGPGFAGEFVPSLPEALALLAELGLQPNIEIKPGRGREVETAEVVLAEAAAAWPAPLPPPLISSFSPACLRVARDRRPEWPRGLIAMELPRDWRTLLGELRCRSLHLSWKRTSRSIVQAVKEAGYGLACFTVNDPLVARRLRGWGVDCLISDRPGEIAAAIAGAPGPEA